MSPAPQPGGRGDRGPAGSVGFTLSQLGYAVSRRFHETLAPVGLEPRQFALLRHIALAEGRTQQAFGETLQIPASRMVALIDELEGRGLVERRTNPTDRRARALHLTDGGRALLAEAFALAVGLEKVLCAGLRREEQASLLDLLHRVAVNLGLADGAHPGLGGHFPPPSRPPSRRS